MFGLQHEVKSHIGVKHNRGREHDTFRVFSAPEHEGITAVPSVLHSD